MEQLLAESNYLLQKEIIPRKRYYDRLESLITTKQIIVIQGQRRVGKSHVVMGYLQSLGKSKEKIFFFNKELDKKNQVVSSNDLATLYETFVHKYGKPEYIVIDEIQDIIQREVFIRALFAEKNSTIIISGSNTHLLSGELGTYLSGRYVTLEVFPLDYDEYLLFTHQNNTTQSLKTYTTIGGLPEIALIPDRGDKINYCKNVINTIFIKDIVSRYTIRDIGFLEKLLSFLSNTMGSSSSLRNIQGSAKHYGRDAPSINTLSNYIGYLKNAYLIHTAERFDIHGKKLLEHHPKIYFNDIGIRNCLLLDYDKDKGKILENLVYLHLKKLGYTVRVGSFGTKEIDFVIQSPQGYAYIQVAYLLLEPETREREFGNLLNIKDSYPKYCVTLDPYALDYQGIKHYYFPDFLKLQTLFP